MITTVSTAHSQIRNDHLSPASLVPPGTAALPSDFPSRLARIKDSSGLSWNGLAEKLGVDARQIFRWRRGVQPNGGAMLALIQFASLLPDGDQLFFSNGHAAAGRGPAFRADRHPYRRPFTEFPKDFPARIERLRNVLGITWRDFAQRVGTDPKTVMHWRAGRKRPNGKHVIALLRFADEDLLYLEILLGHGTGRRGNVNGHRSLVGERIQMRQVTSFPNVP